MDFQIQLMLLFVSELCSVAKVVVDGSTHFSPFADVISVVVMDAAALLQSCMHHPQPQTICLPDPHPSHPSHIVTTHSFIIFYFSILENSVLELTARLPSVRLPSDKV